MYVYVFIRYLTESISLTDLRIKILDETDFPSGRMYHEHPVFVNNTKNHKQFPYVWHMCWTDNRGQKVDHYTSLGLWFLPRHSPKNICVNGAEMLKNENERVKNRIANMRARARNGYIEPDLSRTVDLVKLCCTESAFWSKTSYVT